jgi:hypothetical protein
MNLYLITGVVAIGVLVLGIVCTTMILDGKNYTWSNMLNYIAVVVDETDASDHLVCFVVTCILCIMLLWPVTNVLSAIIIAAILFKIAGNMY